jgi:G3E family GTPase
LLTDQIEFANVILLNKTDLVTSENLGVLREIIQKLNPKARILETRFSKINPKELLNTGLFNFEEAEQSAGWIEELNKEEHIPETEEYGIGSFIYRSKKPFDPIRFSEFIQERFPTNIIRSKGLFWLASRPEQALVWGQAGGSLNADSAGVWWSSMNFENRIRNLTFIEN